MTDHDDVISLSPNGLPFEWEHFNQTNLDHLFVHIIGNYKVSNYFTCCVWFDCVGIYFLHYILAAFADHQWQGSFRGQLAPPKNDFAGILCLNHCQDIPELRKSCSIIHLFLKNVAMVEMGNKWSLGVEIHWIHTFHHTLWKQSQKWCSGGGNHPKSNIVSWFL